MDEDAQNSYNPIQLFKEIKVRAKFGENRSKMSNLVLTDIYPFTVHAKLNTCSFWAPGDLKIHF